MQPWCNGLHARRCCRRRRGAAQLSTAAWSCEPAGAHPAAARTPADRRASVGGSTSWAAKEPSWGRAAAPHCTTSSSTRPAGRAAACLRHGGVAVPRLPVQPQNLDVPALDGGVHLLVGVVHKYAQHLGEGFHQVAPLRALGAQRRRAGGQTSEQAARAAAPRQMPGNARCVVARTSLCVATRVCAGNTRRADRLSTIHAQLVALVPAACGLGPARTLKGHFLNCQALPRQMTATTRSQSCLLLGSLSARTAVEGADGRA